MTVSKNLFLESTVRSIKNRRSVGEDGGKVKKRGRKFALGRHEALVKDTVTHLGKFQSKFTKISPHCSAEIE